MKSFILSFLFCFSASAQTLPDFRLPIFENKGEFKLADHLGKRTIVINFWASWCTSCIGEIPLLHALKEKYNKEDVLFIGLNAGDSSLKIKKFISKYGFNYLILEDKDKTVSKSFGVESLPQTFVISKEKKIVFKGVRPPEKL